MLTYKVVHPGRGLYKWDFIAFTAIWCQNSGPQIKKKAREK